MAGNSRLQKIFPFKNARHFEARQAGLTVVVASTPEATSGYDRAASLDEAGRSHGQPLEERLLLRCPSSNSAGEQFKVFR